MQVITNGIKTNLSNISVRYVYLFDLRIPYNTMKTWFMHEG